MYQIKCDSHPLLDLRDDELIVASPKVKIEANTVGEASFTIYNKHPYYDKLQNLKSIFEVRDDVGVVFRGRMTNDSYDFNNGKAVDLEGLMAFFNDSLVRPYAFPDDFLENAEYITAAESGNVVKFFLKWLIDNHNSQVQEFQRFKLGKVTVSDPNNYITRSDSGYNKTWDVLKAKLFESDLGGYLCIRYEEDGNFIDYLADFELTNPQDITYGENLLDLNRENDATTTYSAILPIGAEIENESEDGEGEAQRFRVTLADLPDGDITDDIVKSGDTLYSKSAVAKYGWIYAPVADTTWDDVTDAKNLQTKGVAHLVQTAVMLLETMEFTAVDQHFTDAEIQSFRIYRKQRVHTIPHGISAVYNLTKLEIPLLEPQNTKITVGETRRTLTGINSQEQSEAINRIQTAEKDIADNRTGVTEAKNQIVVQATEIINDCNEIIMGALKSYVATSDLEKFQSTVESQLSLMADQMNLRFTETTTQINKVNGDLQEKFNTITKYFTFDINGLQIGSVDENGNVSPNKVIIDNDEIIISVNGVEVQRFDSTGKSLIPELDVTRGLHLFGYLVDQDAKGNVNCEYIGNKGDE